MMLRLRKRTLFFSLLIFAVAYLAGYFFGSALPSPGYIGELSTMPLQMNSPEDVSEIIRRNLPDDPAEAFRIVAESSSEIEAKHREGCDCLVIRLGRVVRRLPVPDRELDIYFEVKEGRLKYEGASIVIWFL